MARAGRQRVRLRTPAGLAVCLTAIAIAAMLTGCATVPTDSGPRAVTAGGGQAQAYVRLLPPPGPGKGWSPRDVVLGFLKASASYAIDPAAARRYLIPPLRKTWQPGPVTIVSSLGSPTKVPNPSQLPRLSARLPEKRLTFAGQRLATLGPTGQYQYSPGSYNYSFILAKVGGIWLIAGLPESPAGTRVLLLMQSDFKDVFEPRNLYFYAAHSTVPNLVPDPVYVPLQSSNSADNISLAAYLVRGVLNDQGSWLSDATSTAFPPGTKLLGVSISGETATVNLGGSVVYASKAQKFAMQVQLQATLASNDYAPALVSHVKLQINGTAPWTGVEPVPINQVVGGPLYYLSGTGTVTEQAGAGAGAGAGAHQTALDLGLVDVTAIAAEPSYVAGQHVTGQHVAAAVAANGGCTLYVRQPGKQYSSYQLSATGGACTSLSWDSNDDIWATARHHIWMLRAGTKRPETVSLPSSFASGGPSAPDILGLRMAPDGVRAALLVKIGKAKRTVVAAASYQGNRASLGKALPVGTGLSGPLALSWYDAYNLLVMTRSGIFEVPMTGGAGQPVGSVPAGAQALTTNGSELAVSTDNGQILTSSNLGTSWSAKQIAGSVPDYPG